MSEVKVDHKIYIDRDHLLGMLRRDMLFYYSVDGLYIKIGEATAMHASDEYWAGEKEK